MTNQTEFTYGDKLQDVIDHMRSQDVLTAFARMAYVDGDRIALPDRSLEAVAKLKNHLEPVYREFGIDSTIFISQNGTKPAEAKDTHYEPYFTRYSMVDLDNEPDKEYLVTGIFGPCEIGMIFGDSGSGKTFIVIDLILSCLLGLFFADKKFKVSKPLSVAYCTDEGLGGIKGRFKSARKKYNVESEHSFILKNFHYFKLVPQLFEPSISGFADVFVRDFRHTVGDNLDILVIDTLQNASIGAIENSNDDARTIATHAKMIARDLGCTVILVHHIGKDSSRGPRGAGAYKQHCDFMIQIDTKGKDVAKMSSYKQKDDDNFDPLQCTRTSIPDHKFPILEWSESKTEEGSKSTYDKCWDYLSSNIQEKYTASQVADVLNMEQSNIKPVLDKLAKDGKAISDLKDPERKPSNVNPTVYQADPLEVMRPL